MKNLYILNALALVGFLWTSFAPVVSADDTSRTDFDATATPAEKIHVPDGFSVELLYSVPKEQQGSWVNLCVDGKGRLIVSDQYGKLYRVDVPAESAKDEIKIEPIELEIGEAQGLLWAFDSLYVVVNSGDVAKCGLYRLRDTDQDDRLDSVELLRNIEGNGEHGPHAVLLAPDGKSLYVVCGNSTKPMKVAHSRVPELWDEDRLLPRIYGVGFMRDARPPAGAVYNVDPSGARWERIASGFRNPFDLAFNADGELFTFDADMEWDIGTAWYRPTRVCHVVSGSEWSWRTSSAKWPVHFADTLPPVANIGLSSPTGITFGYNAKFPAKYQTALYLCDWTYGKMYAVHLEPQDSTYTATAEEFMWATPLPFTDVTINPHDGAMYFLIGGRKTQSGLYRVTYRGSESTARADARMVNLEQRELRRKLAALHTPGAPSVVEQAWPYLNHRDRFVRHAARTALEHQPLEAWQERALKERDSQSSLTALLGLVRKVPRAHKPVTADLDPPPPVYPTDDAKRHPLHARVIDALGRLDWQSLSQEQRRELARVYQLALYRLGPPDERTRGQLITRLDSFYPSDDRELNVMLTELMCYLQAPSAASKGVELLLAAPTQEEQIDFVHSLRFLKEGWTLETRRKLFEWHRRAQAYKGGNNFPTFLKELFNDSLANTSDEHKVALKDLIDAQASAATNVAASEPRPFVKEWTMDELIPLVETKLSDRNFARGRAMFAAANCYSCHHFANEGGAVGPDLTGLAGRFSARDILESVLEPNKVISDQYAASLIETADGQIVVGRLTNFSDDRIVINTRMEDPNAITEVKRGDIVSMEKSDTSMMPTGLLNTLDEDEVLDLMAYLLSRGDAKSPMFAPKQTSRASRKGTASDAAN
jgi:putative heme-binding domain-containing protein